MKYSSVKKKLKRSRNLIFITRKKNLAQKINLSPKVIFGNK